MSPIAKAIALIGMLLATHSAVRAAPADEAKALYERFVAAQNSHDFEAVKAVLLDSPEFLSVTDGRRVWGRDVAIARMASYHKAEVWRITPNMARAVAVEVNDRTAYLTMPLLLEIGVKADGPDRFTFIISALCTQSDQGWKIAALFTTLSNER